jgi:hypothetical protein
VTQWLFGYDVSMTEQQPEEDPTDSQAASEPDQTDDSASSGDSSDSGGSDGSSSSSSSSSSDGSDGSGDSGGSGGSAPEPGAISDEQLPEDLQPTEDNPLARHPRQTGDEDDRIGANVEGGDADNPSASMGYGSDDNESSGDEDDESGGGAG